MSPQSSGLRHVKGKELSEMSGIGKWEVVVEYSDRMKVLAQKLLGLISESLGLPPLCIEEVVGEFYQKISKTMLRVFTFFKDGEWVNVHPLSNAIVVMLADQTEIITNGKYISAQHRAITNGNKARLSVATFHDPAKTVTIFPTCELVSDDSPLRYQQVIYGDYVSLWYTKGPSKLSMGTTFYHGIQKAPKESGILMPSYYNNQMMVFCLRKHRNSSMSP